MKGGVKMNEQVTQLVEKLKNNPEIIKSLSSKEETVKLIAKETNMPEAECAKIYDAIVEKVKGGIAGKLGGKLPFNFG